MTIHYRLGDLPCWHGSGISSDDIRPAGDVAVECLTKHYADREWPATGPHEWTTTVHMSTGESVRVSAKMRPQLCVERYVPAVSPMELYP